MPRCTEDSSAVTAAEKSCCHGPAEERAEEGIWPLVKPVFSLDRDSRVCDSCLQNKNVTRLGLEATAEL